MRRWCDELRFRVWKHKSLLLRIGTVGPDWDLLPDEIFAFAYINEGMARKRHATMPQDGANGHDPMPTTAESPGGSHDKPN